MHFSNATPCDIVHDLIPYVLSQLSFVSAFYKKTCWEPVAQSDCFQLKDSDLQQILNVLKLIPTL